MMQTKALSKKRQTLFYGMAIIFFCLLLGLTYQVVKQLISAQHWLDLIHDIDHRMPANSKKFFTNSDQIRSEREASDIKSGDFNIIFLGDSFVYGFLLGRKDFPPPAQLETMMRTQFNRDDINVWNFGWTSSSPILQLRLLKDLGKKYQADLVILAVDMSDYRDDYFYRSMINDQGIFHAVNNYPRSTFLIKQFLAAIDPYTGLHKKVFGYTGNGGYFNAREPMEDNLPLYDEIYDSLNQVHAYSRDELKAPFVTFLPPRHWQYTDKESPETWEAGSFDALGPYALENYRYFAMKQSTTPYPLVSLLDDFKQTQVFPTTFKKDSHWNKHGAKVAAQSVFNYLLNNNYLNALQKNP